MKILAIDIGSANVKAVVVDTKFRRFNISLHDVVPVSDALEPLSLSDGSLSPGQIAALNEIAIRHGEGVDRIVTNLPLSLYSSRFLSFPFRDKRKIQNAVKFAIEDEVPFDLEKCILSSHAFHSEGKESNVLTAFAPLDSLEPFVETLDSIGLKAGVLMTDEAAYASLFLGQKTPLPSRGVAVLNIGHRKSGIFLFRDQLPVSHRITMTGGYHLTEAISKNLRIGMREAELAKIDHNEETLPAYALEALAPLLHDAQQGLMAYSSRYGESVSTVYLTGGGSLLHGLREYLENLWNCRVEFLVPTNLHPQLSLRPQKNTEALLAVSIGLGFTQVHGLARSLLNLREGKLKLAGESFLPRFEELAFPLKLAAAVYIAAALSLFGQNFLLDNSIDQKTQTLEAAIKNVLGASSASYIEALATNPERLKRTVDAKVEEAGGRKKEVTGKKGIAVLDALQRLSQKVPRSTPLEIKKIEVSDNSATFEFESPTDNDANTALHLIKETPPFQSATATPVTTTPSGRKSFRISMQGSLGGGS